jgi:hypothetical protein
MPQVDLRALDNTIRYLEETVRPALLDYVELPFPLAVGDLREFPRPSLSNQVAERGLIVLQESVDNAVAALSLLMAAAENGREVPEGLLALVQPLIDAARRATGGGNGASTDKP